MKHFLGLLFIILINFPAMAAEEIQYLKIKQAYTYATAASQKNGAVFGVLKNNTQKEINIISAKSDVAERVELHTHLMDGDIMMMRKVDQYTIPASGEVTLEPSGHHIMLMGLKAPLKAGEAFDLYITNDNHEDILMSVAIKNPGDISP